MRNPSDLEGHAAALSPREATNVSLVVKKRADADLEPSNRPRFADFNRAAPEVHLLDYVRVIYKRRWTAATVLFVVVSSVVVYILTATPTYEATTTLLIEAEKQNVAAFKDVVDQIPTTDEYYQTQYKLLASHVLAARTLETLKLWDHPDLSPSSRAEQVGAGGTVSRTWQAVLSGTRHLFGPSGPPAQLEPGETPQQSKAIEAFLSKLIVSPIRNTRLVEVKFRSADRAIAAKVANAHARAYMQQNLEFRFVSSKDLSDWLGDRLAEQRKKVEDSEVAVQRYRELNNALPLDERQNIVDQKLSDISAAVTRAKTVRIEKESLYKQMEAVERDRNALDSFPAILSNAYVQQLKVQIADLQRQQAQLSDQLGNRHPDLIKVRTALEAAEAKLQTAIAQVVQSSRTDYLAAAAQERSLTDALEAQKREALAFNRTAIEGNVLKRDADSNRQLYEGLLQRTKETGVAGELKPSNIRIVDQADVPRDPISPNKLRSLLLALVGGPLLGIGLVFFFEYLDDRIKTPDEIRTHLGLPTLGLIPRVAAKQLGAHPLISNGVPQNFTEAFRTVGASVLFSSDGGRARTVLVTSTTPGEGKTLSASNLAVGLAQAGERVLLIDCDVRRPTVHLVFGIEQEPGLSELLGGRARAKDAIRSSSVPTLWVLPAGSTPSNPAELLGSKRFKEFLSSLDECFDRVVLDSPPVLAVTDAAILAHLAHGIVFVIGAELTSRLAAATAVDRLESAGGQFIGAVLNRVNLDRHGYYYSGYYGRGYASYYVRAASS